MPLAELIERRKNMPGKKRYVDSLKTLRMHERLSFPQKKSVDFAKLFSIFFLPHARFLLVAHVFFFFNFSKNIDFFAQENN